MPLSEGWQVLGYANYRQCWRKIRSKHYRIGHEVVDRRSPHAADPEYWLDIEKCRARDSVIPAKRSA
ncbi:hypothetical protein H6G00_00080 [Leptolyngbya sp. FACHB-541]|uniref:hypothetical protein n=1 Tax=Leptolyngbya sp. FACHB-541 TaxID=2692810 RepID=UPI0016827483|nr:hypothetical protein [Leptolyngbya sp. FACHB-541]MBD1995029.1 hypothetical protein [Leptolyngbya sp. FACHB-541]